MARGQLDGAVACYRQALALDRDCAEAHNGLGNALRRLGQPDAAAASYRRALALGADFAGVYINLGNTLVELGKHTDAADCYRHALALRPELDEIHHSLGEVLRTLGQLEQAEHSYRRAIALKPDYAAAYTHLALTLRLQQRTGDAEASCRRALEFDPTSTSAIMLLADLRADSGHFSAAEELFKRAISIEAHLPEAWAGIAHLRKMTPADTAWLAQTQRIADSGVPIRQQVYLRYALGKYFDDVGDYEQAFISFRCANELTKQQRGAHDRQRVTEAIERIIQLYDRSWISQQGDGHARATSSTTQPVFIVGMPRSGTSLAEQILASHCDVFGAGELTFWKSSAARYRVSMLGGEPSEQVLDSLAQDYLQLLHGLSSAARVVDKMPANFLFLGLIHAALPHARIIHMQRDPIDTCLSIYCQHFESAHSYANDLEDLAHYYSQYLRLMAHWREVLPKGTMMDLPYEALVDEPESRSRRLIEFIGLPWDPQCLNFQCTERAVLTASKWQVRQRIHTSSVRRWRNYQAYIGPLLQLQTPR